MHIQLCPVAGSTQLFLALPSEAPSKLHRENSSDFLGVLLSEEHSRISYWSRRTILGTIVTTHVTQAHHLAISPIHTLWMLTSSLTWNFRHPSCSIPSRVSSTQQPSILLNPDQSQHPSAWNSPNFYTFSVKAYLFPLVTWPYIICPLCF